MPAPYTFRFDQDATVGWTEIDGSSHGGSFRTGAVVGPFDNPCNALRFLNGAIDAGVPLQKSAEADYQEVVEQCAAAGGPTEPGAVPPEPAPQPEPSATAPDAPPPGGGDNAGTMGAPDPGPGFTIEPTSSRSDAPDPRPPAEQYFAPNPTPDYQLADQLLAQGAAPGDLDSLLGQIRRNEPQPGRPHRQFGLDDNDFPALLSDPVDVFSGSYTLSLTDVYLPSRGFPLQLTRMYRSGPVYFGPWGCNWDHNYNVYLRELADGGVAVWIGALSEHVYAPAAGGGFDPPLGIFTKLERLGASGADPERFVLTDRQGREQVFLRPPAWPHPDRIPLARLADRHGNRHELTYDGEGRLQRVADQAGRFIQLGYGDCALLERVTDHTGRVWRYAHDEEAEHLVAVTTPATAEHPDGLTTRYAYDRYREHPQLRHNLVEVLGADGRVVVQNEYGDDPGDDDFGRVVRQEYGGFEATFHATPLQLVPRLPDAINVPALRVETVDPGVLHVYTFNFRGDVLDHRLRLVRDGSYRLVARNYRYDGQGNPIERREPNGLGALYTYDFEGADPRARGNLLKLELVAPPTAAAPSRVVAMLTYEPQFHRPKTYRDPNGRITRWTYDFETGSGAVGDLVRLEYPTATLPDGTSQPRAETFAYDAHGELREHVTAEGHVHRFAYGAAGPGEGLLSEVLQDAGGAAQVERYEYDARGWRSATIDGLGRRTEIVRDALDQIVAVRLAAVGGTVDEARFSYSPLGCVRREELPRGEYDDGAISDPFLANEYEHDVLGYLERATYGANTARPLSAAFRHDAEGNVEEVVDEIGRRTVFEYDERGLPLSQTEAAGTAVAAELRRRYDRNGNLTAVVDAAGHRHDYSYDPWDRIRRMRLPGSPEAARTRIEIEHDELDKPETVRVVGRTASTAVGILSERHTEYDERGRAVRQVQGARSTTVVHDADERPLRHTDQRGGVTVLAYDGLDRVVRVEDAGGNEVVRSYDAAGQLVSVEQRDALPGGAGTETLTTTIGYDERARPTRVEDALGNATETRYDARDMPVRAIDPLGRPVERRFGLRGDLLEVTALAAPGVPLVHRFGYDDAGRPVSYMDPLGRVTSFELDERDRRTAIVYPDGRVHRFAFGARLQVESETTPGGTGIAYTYGADAGLAEIAFSPAPGVAATPDIQVERDGLRRGVRLRQGPVEVRREFDSALRLVSETVDGRTASVGYDDVAGAARFEHPDGRVDLLRFDPLGRLASVELQAKGSAGLTGSLATGTVLGSYAYRGPDRIARRTLSNGVDTGFEYDDAGRLAAILHTDASATRLAALRYVDDAAGQRRVVWSDPAPQGPARMDYDGVGRLRHADLDLALPEPPAAPSQAEADAAIAAASGAAAARSEDYVVTGSDARAADTRADAGAVRHAGYTLAAADQIVKVDRTGPGAGSFPFVFDDDGRCVQDDRHSYVYDALGQLVEVSELAGPTILKQKFDPAGRVLSRTEAGTTRRYAYHGLRAVETAGVGGGPLSQVTFGVGLDEALMESDGANRHPLEDAAASVVCRTDSSGAVIERYAYTPFGEAQIFAPDGVTPRPTSAIGAGARFAGHPLLACGLYDSRARVYDPVTGRFLQPDPVGYADSACLYSYAHHDPVGHVDPTGEVAIVVGLLVAAGVGLVAGAGINAARQGIQMHEGARDEFSYGEMLLSGGIGAVAAPVLFLAPELAVPLAAYGVSGGASEIAQGNWETGTFDIATSVIPFGLKGVRASAWGEGSVVGQWRGLGPSATRAERLARFPQVASTTRGLVSRAWNDRFYHGTTQRSAAAAVRDPAAHIRMVRVVQQYPGARHLGPGLYFTRAPGNPAVPGTPAWWASRGGSIGAPGPGAVVEATVPRWRLAFLRRQPGVQIEVPQAGTDVPQSFFPFEGPVDAPTGPAVRFGQLARWRIYDPAATRPSLSPLWPALLAPEARWPTVATGGRGPK